MNDRIIQYLEGELSKDEMLLFEKDLNTSNKFKREFEEILSSNSKFNEIKNIKIDETYSNGVIPEFRKRLDVKKRARKIFSFSFANSLAAIIIIYVIFSPSNNNFTLEDSIKSWSENDFKYAVEYVNPRNINLEISNYYSSEEIEPIMSEALIDEIVKSGNINNYGTIDYKTIDRQINEKDVNLLYKEILNKKYF